MARFRWASKSADASADLLLVDFTGAVRHRDNLPYDFPDARSLLPTIAQHLRSIRDGLGAQAARLVGVGLAAPLNLGGWHKLLGLPQAVSDEWNLIDLRTQVQSFSEAPVSFAKDTSAACVAELVAGRGRDLKSFCTCLSTPLSAAAWSSTPTCTTASMATPGRSHRCRCKSPAASAFPSS